MESSKKGSFHSIIVVRQSLKYKATLGISAALSLTTNAAKKL